MVDSRLFQALSDPTRLKILGLLAQSSMNVSRMVERTKCAQPAVSRHLRVLKEVALIRNVRKGKEVEYSLDFRRLAEAAVYLGRLGGSGLMEIMGASGRAKRASGRETEARGERRERAKQRRQTPESSGRRAGRAARAPSAATAQSWRSPRAAAPQRSQNGEQVKTRRGRTGKRGREVSAGRTIQGEPSPKVSRGGGGQPRQMRRAPRPSRRPQTPRSRQVTKASGKVRQDKPGPARVEPELRAAVEAGQELRRPGPEAARPKAKKSKIDSARTEQRKTERPKTQKPKIDRTGEFVVEHKEETMEDFLL